MKNIHVLPTDKPSRLFRLLSSKKIHISEPYKKLKTYTNLNIYITSDEEIKEGDWYWLEKIDKIGSESGAYKSSGAKVSKLNTLASNCKKIILTTDQDLIKDGVHHIDYEFLEWFVKNPSCEFVEVKSGVKRLNSDGEEIGFPDMSSYKIIIPKEENFKHELRVLSKEEVLTNRSSAYEFIDFDKQETLEEASKKEYNDNLFDYEKYRDGFIIGAKWQSERMYSEEELKSAFKVGFNIGYGSPVQELDLKNEHCEKWFEQFKKK